LIPASVSQLPKRYLATETNSASASSTSAVADEDDSLPSLDEFAKSFDVPIIRPRLEEHFVNTLMEDLMVLTYRHDSPHAPSVGDLKKQEEELVKKSVT
jgi:hypothetical protein